MKKYLINLAKVALFIICFGVAVYIPLSVWDRPSFVGSNPALYQLWHEAEPLIAVIVLSLFFSAGEEKCVTIKIFNNFFSSTVFGMALGVFRISAVITLTLIFDTIHFDTKTSFSHTLLWILAIFVSALTEELLVRGYIFSMISMHHNNQTATITCAILFTVANTVLNDEKNIITVLNSFTTCLLFCMVLIYTKTLWTTIVMNFIWKLTGDLCFGILTVNENYPTIFTTRLDGNDLISGGVNGVEGTVFLLGVNILLFIYILAIGAKRSLLEKKKKKKKIAVSN